MNLNCTAQGHWTAGEGSCLLYKNRHTALFAKPQVMRCVPSLLPWECSGFQCILTVLFPLISVKEFYCAKLRKQSFRQRSQLLSKQAADGMQDWFLLHSTAGLHLQQRRCCTWCSKMRYKQIRRSLAYIFSCCVRHNLHFSFSPLVVLHNLELKTTTLP